METPQLKVLITGASQGIGRAVASAFAKAGAHLALHYFGDKSQTEANYPELSDVKSNINWFQADFNNIAEINQLVKDSWNTLGSINLLINNAGISFKTHFLDYTPNDIDSFLNINFRGTILVTQGVARLMVKSEVKGAVYTITSVNGIRPSVGLSVYGASKAALEVAMKGAAMELAPHSIRVNTIALGAIETPMNEGLLKDEEKLQQVTEFIPLGRLGHAEEVAQLILNLVNVDSYMTGNTIVFDGGWLLKTGYALAKPYHDNL